MAYSPTGWQLTHLLQRVYLRLKIARVSTATGGSTTTIVDSKLADFLSESNADDVLNGYTAIIIKDAGGAGAAPEGEFKFVSDYSTTGPALTVESAFSGSSSPANGDRYMYASPYFPIYDMIEIVNDALFDLGDIPVPDTSMTTAAAQTEYSLPSNQITKNTLLDLWIQGITSDSNDNRWIPVQSWDITPPTTPGGTATLIIPQFPSGRKLYLLYAGRHPRVEAYSDDISRYIPQRVAVAAVVAQAIQWFNRQRGGSDKYWLGEENRAWNQLDIAKAQNPVVTPVRRIQGMPNGRSFSSEFPTIPYPP